MMSRKHRKYGNFYPQERYRIMVFNCGLRYPKHNGNVINSPRVPGVQGACSHLPGVQGVHMHLPGVICDIFMYNSNQWCCLAATLINCLGDYLSWNSPTNTQCTSPRTTSSNSMMKKGTWIEGRKVKGWGGGVRGREEG